ncbi:dTDP-4-amino-4,6-dideoxy-D-glucose transaminase [compost metagenome]
MNELQAAFGLLQLKHIDTALAQRKAVYERYRQAFEGLPGLSLLEVPAGLKWNFAYCPVLIDEQHFGCSRDALYERYREKGILVRRYFYPLISEFPMYRGLPSAALSGMPHALHVSRQVLCLPIYPQLGVDTQQTIIDIALACRA